MLCFALALWNRQDTLLKELGGNMTTAESALAALIEEADWATLQERMAAHNFKGERIIMELGEDHTVK